MAQNGPKKENTGKCRNWVFTLNNYEDKDLERLANPYDLHGVCAHTQHINIRTQRCAYTRARTNTHSQAHTCTLTHTHAHAHTHVHTHTHAQNTHSRTNSHTNTHTYIQKSKK